MQQAGYSGSAKLELKYTKAGTGFLMTQEGSRIKALMPLTDLRAELRTRGIIDVPRSTVRNWYLFGVSTGNGRIKLKTRKVGNRRMSSVEWTLNFLDEQDSA